MPNIGSHPEISSLIRFKDLARENLNKGNYEEGLKNTYYLMLELQTDDQDTNLKKELIKELRVLKKFKYNGGKLKWVFQNSFKYDEWYEKIIQILWDKHYLQDQKYDGSGFNIFEKDSDFEEV